MRRSIASFSLLLAFMLSGCGEEDTKKDKDGQRSTDQSTFLPGGNGGIPTQTQTFQGGNQFSSQSGKQTVDFQGSRGDRVPAFLYHPGQPGKLPTVMVQYGITGDKGSGKIEQVANVLNQQGYIVMVIDVPGRGERTNSTGDIDPVETVLNHDLFRWYVDDYGAAASYLASRPDVDANRLAYMGASWGAITGIPFVARDQRIKAVVSVVGGGGFFGVIPQDLDPAVTVRQIAPRPVMLINATNDQVILQPFWQALHSAAPPNTQKVLLNTDHTLSGVDINQLMNQVVGFLQTSLR